MPTQGPTDDCVKCTLDSGWYAKCSNAEINPMGGHHCHPHFIGRDPGTQKPPSVTQLVYSGARPGTQTVRLRNPNSQLHPAPSLPPPSPRRPGPPQLVGHGAGWDSSSSPGRTPLGTPPPPGPLSSATDTHIWGSKDQVAGPGCWPHWEQLTGFVPGPFKVKELP